MAANNGSSIPSCPNNTISTNTRRLCATCPLLDPLGPIHAASTFLAQSPYGPNGIRPNSTIFQSQQDASHQGKFYCGSEPYIIDSIIYSLCYPQTGFQNPYNYSRLGTNLECFNQGKGIGGNNFSNNNNNPPPNLPRIPPPPALPRQFNINNEEEEKEEKEEVEDLEPPVSSRTRSRIQL